MSREFASFDDSPTNNGWNDNDLDYIQFGRFPCTDEQIELIPDEEDERENNTFVIQNRNNNFISINTNQ